MEKKILGIILSVLGIAGLILALVNMNQIGSSKNVNILFAGGIMGAVAFFVGVWLLPKERNYDKPVKVSYSRISE